MVRKYVDCRDMPSASNCTVRISGSEDEVLRLAARHAVEDHGHTDGPELVDSVRSLMHDEIL